MPSYQYSSAAYQRRTNPKTAAAKKAQSAAQRTQKIAATREHFALVATNIREGRIVNAGALLRAIELLESTSSTRRTPELALKEAASIKSQVAYCLAKAYGLHNSR